MGTSPSSLELSDTQKSMGLKYEPSSEPQVSDSYERGTPVFAPPDRAGGRLWVGNSVGDSDVEGNSDVW